MTYWFGRKYIKQKERKTEKNPLKFQCVSAKVFRQNYVKYDITRNHLKIFDFLQVIHKESNKLRHNMGLLCVDLWPVGLDQWTICLTADKEDTLWSISSLVMATRCEVDII